MKADERHEIEQNDLANQLARLTTQARPYLPMILGAFAVAILGVVIWAQRAQAHKTRLSDAWQTLSEAKSAADYDLFVKNYGDLEASLYAKLKAADLSFNEGKMNLLKDRSESLDKLERAIELYRAVVNDPKSSKKLQARASLAAALAAETKGMTETAAKEYKKIAESFPGTFEAMQAEDRAKKIDGPGAGKFYAFLADYKPPKVDLPPLQKETGGDNPLIPLPPILKEPATTKSDPDTPVLPESKIKLPDAPPVDAKKDEPAKKEEPAKEATKAE